MQFLGSDQGMSISKFINSLGPKEAIKNIYIDKFFASILADPNAARNDYMFSRVLAKLIHSRVAVDGIAFPSVKDQGGFNMAVEAEASDNIFQNVCCIVVRIEKHRRFGIIEFAKTRSAERLDREWNFIWGPEREDDVVTFYNLSKEEAEMAAQHSDPQNALLHMLHLNAKRQ